jgi:hypothetical protein
LTPVHLITWTFHTGDADTAHHSQTEVAYYCKRVLWHYTKIICIGCSHWQKENGCTIRWTMGQFSFIMNNNALGALGKNCRQTPFFTAGSFLSTVITGNQNHSVWGKIDLQWLGKGLS